MGHGVSQLRPVAGKAGNLTPPEACRSSSALSSHYSLVAEARIPRRRLLRLLQLLLRAEAIADSVRIILAAGDQTPWQLPISFDLRLVQFFFLSFTLLSPPAPSPFFSDSGSSLLSVLPLCVGRANYYAYRTGRPECICAADTPRNAAFSPNFEKG